MLEIMLFVGGVCAGWLIVDTLRPDEVADHRDHLRIKSELRAREHVRLMGGRND